MSLFREAIKAKFTLISVRVDDPAFFKESAESLLGQEVFEYSTSNKLRQIVFSAKHEPTNAEFREMSSNKQTMILLNYEGTNPAVYDVGTLPTPEGLVVAQFEKLVGKKNLPAVLKAVDGLSFTKAKQVLRLAEVRGAGFGYAPIKAIRTELYGTSEGLTLLPSEDVFYEWSQELLAWANLGLPFFLEGDIALAPRGVLLHGKAGTGKTMAAKAISHSLGVPAYRLDISASMSKWQGESEARIRQHLSFVEREAPCILLIDEVEKVISYSSDEPSSARILAQLLWWLAEHKSRVLTIMTSNDITKLPQELYRSGRLDAPIEIGLLSENDAIALGLRWATVFLGNSKSVPKASEAEALDFARLFLADKITEPKPAAQAVDLAKVAIKSFLLTQVPSK